MLAGRSVDPVPGLAVPAFVQTDIQAAPGLTGYIADLPIAALAPPCRKIILAHSKSLTGKLLRDFRSVEWSSVHGSSLSLGEVRFSGSGQGQSAKAKYQAMDIQVAII